MKKQTLAAALLLGLACSNTAIAQKAAGTLTLQPKFGITFSNLTDADAYIPNFPTTICHTTEIVLESKTKTGFVFGMEAEYQISKIFSVSGGALFSMQGCTYDKLAYNGTKVADLSVELNYISIPLLANVYVAKGLAIKAGLQPSLCVHGKQKIDIINGTGMSVSEDIPDMNDIDFSIPIGISYELGNIIVDARYNFGLTDIVKSENIKNRVLQLSLGYKFDI